ncbi:MAG: hypothetical protein EOO03_17680 [Chitinophagaceae bacterium]|nr:MAG: hypothetical protein EOO03_17680 [Chitinophagaceae bacterium]
MLDALGALMTAFVLSTILARFNSYFGMPSHVLYLLVVVACVFMFYSIGCYLWLKRNYRPYLLLIAFANLLYCAFTIGSVGFFYKKITVLGFIYFLLESLVIIGLVLVEKRVSEKL